MVATSTTFSKKIAKKAIPNSLIREVLNGKPYYYKGYKEVLNGTKTLEEIMGSATLQAFLVARIVYLLIKDLDTSLYDVFTNEAGLLFGKKDYTSGDTFIFRSQDLLTTGLDNKYSRVAPYIAIEVDVKIDLEKDNDKEYVFTKIKKYLDFGVSKVIWIFTETQHIIIATQNDEWIITNLDKKIEITDTCTLCILDILNILKEKGIRF